jgi:hypothetical protein
LDSNFRGFIPKLGFFARLYLYIINIADRNSESLMCGVGPGAHSVPFFPIKSKKRWALASAGRALATKTHYIELYDNKRSGTLEAFFPKCDFSRGFLICFIIIAGWNSEAAKG